MTITKATAAPRIMCGFWDGWSFWALFYPTEKPQQEPGEGMMEYRDRVARQVREAAFDYVSEQLAVAQRMGAVLRSRKDVSE